MLLKTPWSDGTSSIQLNTWEMMERLIALIPPPRSHQVLYHGVFANNAKYRRQVLPKYREPVKKHRWWKLTKRGSPKSKHVAWAELLYRAFGVRGWVCEQCGCRMSLRAVVVGEFAVSRIIANDINIEPVLYYHKQENV